MGHFAKVLDGKVMEVIVAEPEFFDTFVDSSPGNWIQTSYNTVGGKHLLGGTPLRGNYAGKGYTYDAEHDVFYPPRPYDYKHVECVSWTIGAPDWTWTAPKPMPEVGGVHVWDEAAQDWINPSGTTVATLP